MRARLPILPIYESQRPPSSEIASDDPLPSADDIEHRLYLESGSAAIALALQHAGVGHGDEVLLPAFHCPTMSEPVLEAGGAPRFYPLRGDLGVELASLEACVGARTRAVLVAHFFGVGHDLSGIRAFCDQTGLCLIEDCAHMFFGRAGRNPVGETGDYAVFSTRKFFPGADGGILASARRALPAHNIEAIGTLREWLYLLDIREEAAHFGRLGASRFILQPLLGARNLAKTLRDTGTARDAAGGDETAARPRGHAATHRAMSRASRHLLEHADRNAIIAARRRNYAALNDAFAAAGPWRPLIADVPPPEVPYMFPLLVERPRVYLDLRDAGWPVWRWDDSHRSCSISDNYREHLLHLPCHQSLTSDDVTLLATAVRKTAAEGGQYA